MQIFADQCINRDLISALRKAGYNIQHTSDVNLQRATDSQILDYAIEHKSILLTFDKDFGNILIFNIKNTEGVVILYIEDMNKEEIIHKTLHFFNEFKESNLKGRLFIVDKTKIRIWPE